MGAYGDDKSYYSSTGRDSMSVSSTGTTDSAASAKSASKTVAFIRNVMQEADAARLGYSKEYIESRGGVNAEGYWGDVPAYARLTAAEQKTVTLPNGNTDTAGQAALYQKKAYDYYVGEGLDPRDAAAKASQGYGQYAITFKDANGNTVVPTANTKGAATTDFGGVVSSLPAEAPANLVASGTSTGTTSATTGTVTTTTTATTSATTAGLLTTASTAKVVGTRTVRKPGGIVQTVQVKDDGTEVVLDEIKDMSASDAVVAMFSQTGLGQAFIDSLVSTINKVYEDNIAPTDAQILSSVYSSDAYKTRFAANEAIRKRLADGKGRPGDRMLTPYEYVQTENSYREIMAQAGLPPGFYDTPEDFSKFIELGVSTAELNERVNIAKNALQNADQQIVQSLKDYYGLNESEMAAYLLDSNKAINLLESRFQYTTEEAKKMYGAAEIGGAARRAGITSDKALAEEIYTAGKQGQAESAFQTAATGAQDYKRLLGLYGAEGEAQDLAREELALAGGTDVTMKKKKLASKERAKFSQTSALNQASLGRRSQTSNV